MESGKTVKFELIPYIGYTKFAESKILTII